MENIALYRKYRPHNFDNLVGQDYIKTTLVNAIKTSHISHAYIFSGPRGTGKTSTARLMAKALNCTDPQDGYEPCDKCEFCNDINDGRLIDLIEIDAASNRGIDEVRDLREKINFAPSRAKYKTYIIDEVHMMTKEAFNALLKTLEEPPSHAFFILATTEIHKIPETIISRCQRFDFKRISQKALMTRLSYIAQLEKIKAEDKALEIISRYVDGGMRDAIGLLEQLTQDNQLTFERARDILGVTDVSLLEDLYENLMKGAHKESINIIHALHDQGSDLKKFVHEFIDLVRMKMLAGISKGDDSFLPRHLQLITVFQEAQTSLNLTSIPQLPLEIAVIKMSGVREPESALRIEKVEKVVEVKKAVTQERAPEVKKEVKKEEVQAVKDESPAPAEDREHKKIIEMTLVNIKNNWPRITERVKTPSVRMSLKSAIPTSVDGATITIQFATNFHRDKIMEPENRVELESVVKDVMGSSVKIETIVKEFELKPVVIEEKKTEEVLTPTNDVLDEALSIFGGEVVD